MPSNRGTVLCRYHYDPLDRLAASTPSAQASAQRFYLKDRLTTEIQGAVQRSIMQHEDQLLAQRERQTTAVHTHLLATDQQRSVLNLLDAVARHALAYTPYGHRHWQNALLSLLGFNGERRDPLTGWYFLGNGYRAFNTVLMRFNSPDSWSPFGKGGANAYAYCVGDPVNRMDPTGHAWNFVRAALRFFGLRRSNMQDIQNARSSLSSPRVASHTATGFQNPLANTLSPYPGAKTPAWTTQDRLAFAGTEARHPGAPRSAASQESLTTFPGDSPNVSPRPIHTRRMGNIFEVGQSGQLLPLYGSNQSINSISSSGSTFDPSPPYSAPLPPPNYGASELPSYQQALVNKTWLDNLSKRQSDVRRNST
ncbi:RHS repeat-associated core domain-containing protein [Pseudomonas moorei]|uniref:RHS repeat-associated core domain-containing protein n=1 Tax=Pseudomonas moorei TaxID=395599 RepID=UPI0036F3B34A